MNGPVVCTSGRRRSMLYEVSRVCLWIFFKVFSVSERVCWRCVLALNSVREGALEDVICVLAPSSMLYSPQGSSSN